MRITPSNVKALRDGGLTGGTTALVAALLIEHGADEGLALVLGAAAGGVVARAYRSARDRWPWLARLDPPR